MWYTLVALNSFWAKISTDFVLSYSSAHLVWFNVPHQLCTERQHMAHWYTTDHTGFFDNYQVCRISKSKAAKEFNLERPLEQALHYRLKGMHNFYILPNRFELKLTRIEKEIRFLNFQWNRSSSKYQQFKRTSFVQLTHFTTFHLRNPLVFETLSSAKKCERTSRYSCCANTRCCFTPHSIRADASAVKPSSELGVGTLIRNLLLQMLQ